MVQFLSSRIILSVVSVFVLFVCVGRVQGTQISGTISTTLTITEDSELVGDVTCVVVDAPCIKLGASGIKLRLDGFTEQIDALFCCGGPRHAERGCGGVCIAATEEQRKTV